MLPQNVAAPMLLAGFTPLETKLIAYGATSVLGLILYLVLRKTRVDPNKRASIGAIKRQGEAVGGVTVFVFGLCFVLLVVLMLLSRVPLWTLLVLVPVAAWAVWWLPGKRRRITSEASIQVQGLPARVSAFVADVPGQVRWSPGAVSCTPQLQGPRGPRYAFVERGPTGREFEGVVTLARDEPGVEVDIQLEGTGASGDYYSFAAQDGGTLVTKRCVVEVPYVLALAGGMFAVRGEGPAAHQRRVDEVQALKMAFESGAS